MSAKNALLVAAAVAVVGMGVYLFIQVRATPAQADATYAANTSKAQAFLGPIEKLAARYPATGA